MESEPPKSDNTSTGVLKAIGSVAFFILTFPAYCVFGMIVEGGPLAIIAIGVLLCLAWIKYR
jgi:hypothetical protein